MEDFRKRHVPAPPAQEANRRRLGQVVHDERGNAFVTWHDAPADEKREVLEILGDAKLTMKTEESYDPYARLAGRPTALPGKPTKPKDLRKLGEWIKLMRELEARKAGGDGD
jgi:hypothetical protein